MLLVRDEKDNKDISKYLAGGSGSPQGKNSGEKRTGNKSNNGRNFSRSPLRNNESSLSKQGS